MKTRILWPVLLRNVYRWTKGSYCDSCTISFSYRKPYTVLLALLNMEYTGRTCNAHWENFNRRVSTSWLGHPGPQMEGQYWSDSREIAVCRLARFVYCFSCWILFTPWWMFGEFLDLLRSYEQLNLCVIQLVKSSRRLILHWVHFVVTFVKTVLDIRILGTVNGMSGPIK
jgi:hypothetical protein